MDPQSVSLKVTLKTGSWDYVGVLEGSGTTQVPRTLCVPPTPTRVLRPSVLGLSEGVCRKSSVFGDGRSIRTCVFGRV